MKLSRAQQIEQLAVAVAAWNKHDGEYACQTRGKEACHHCVALKKLRELLERDVNRT